MKKKIRLYCFIFLPILIFSGCGRKIPETTAYDKVTMQSYADTVIQSFDSMTIEDLDNFKEMSDLELDIALIQSGLPVNSTDFLSMVDAWKTGIEECGTLTQMKAYQMETAADSATLTADASFSERTGEIQFTFDEKMNLKILSIDALYSQKEIMQKASLNTALGMGTVFALLIFISFCISLFRFLPALEKKLFSGKFNKEEEQPVSVEKVISGPYLSTNVIPEEDIELAAVIAAAIATYEGTNTDGFIVRSIRRRTSNKWNS